MGLSEKKGSEREHPYSHFLHIFSAITVIALLFLDMLVFKVSSQLLAFIPWYISVIIGGCVVIIGLFFIIKSHQVLFGTEKQGPTTLITTGVLSHTRNPMYLGILLLHLGCIIIALSLIALGAWVVVIIIYDRMVSFEEQILDEMFGEAFREYKKTVPKWIPR